MFHRFSTVSTNSAGSGRARSLVVAVALAAGSALAQPNPPTTSDAPCASEPTTEETVSNTLDSEGYFSLFNGTDFTGWWQSCQTNHSSTNRTLGAVFRVDPALKAIYSTQRGSSGGILMTKKKFGNYEIVFDYWPDFRNDGGIFHRTPPNGRCFQTVLDYIGGASLGGTWGEGGFTSRDYRPFSFGADESSLIIPGNNVGDPSNWTTITQRMRASGQQFDCPMTGCTQADWRRLWDIDGWNQIRIQFYGGLTAANNRVRMKSFFRKMGATEWIPISADTSLMQVVEANYIGLQVHGGGRFSGPKGTWYRNIRWTPLTELGARVHSPPVGTESIPEGRILTDIQASANALVGFLDSDHKIRIKDMMGRTLQTVSGKAGRFEYAFVEAARKGWLTLEIKTSKGTQFRRIKRDLDM